MLPDRIFRIATRMAKIYRRFVFTSPRCFVAHVEVGGSVKVSVLQTTCRQQSLREIACHNTVFSRHVNIMFWRYMTLAFNGMFSTIVGNLDRVQFRSTLNFWGRGTNVEQKGLFHRNSQVRVYFYTPHLCRSSAHEETSGVGAEMIVS